MTVRFPFLRTPIICGLAIAGWAGISLIALQNFVTSQGKSPDTEWELLFWDESREPKRGVFFSWLAPELGKVVHGRELPFLLVAMGECNSCSLDSFDEDIIPVNKVKPIRVFRDHGSISNVRRNPDSKSQITLEARLSTTDYGRLNAAFSPRLYLCTAGGTLSAQQSPGETAAAFITRCLR